MGTGGRRQREVAAPDAWLASSGWVRDHGGWSSPSLTPGWADPEGPLEVPAGMGARPQRGPSRQRALPARCRQRCDLRRWWWACQDLNLGPHPYQQNAGNRCAKRRSRRSRSTVGAEVKCSHSVQLCALTARLPTERWISNLHFPASLKEPMSNLAARPSIRCRSTTPMRKLRRRGGQSDIALLNALRRT